MKLLRFGNAGEEKPGLIDNRITSYEGAKPPML